MKSPLQDSFARVRRTAQGVVRSRSKTLSVVNQAFAKAYRHPAPLRAMQADLVTLMRMVRAWSKREYRQVPWRSLVLAVAALLYFLNPADLVPDLLLYVGFTDDLAVLSMVLGALSNDLARFTEWESARSLSPLPSVEP